MSTDHIQAGKLFRDEVFMICPSCQTELVMSDRQGIEIDYCPKCRGVWLDRGELDKIIERSMSMTAPDTEQGSARGNMAGGFAGGLAGGGLGAIAGQVLKEAGSRYMQGKSGYSGYGHKGTPYGYKKKKSWLKQIFD